MVERTILENRLMATTINNNTYVNAKERNALK